MSIDGPHCGAYGDTMDMGRVSFHEGGIGPKPLGQGVGAASTRPPFSVHRDSPIGKSVISSQMARHHIFSHRMNIMGSLGHTGKSFDSEPQGTLSLSGEGPWGASPSPSRLPYPYFTRLSRCSSMHHPSGHRVHGVNAWYTLGIRVTRATERWGRSLEVRG